MQDFCTDSGRTSLLRAHVVKSYGRLGDIDVGGLSDNENNTIIRVRVRKMDNNSRRQFRPSSKIRRDKVVPQQVLRDG